MSGLFDRLIDPSGDEEDNSNPGGLTPLDMADLPPLQRRIMFTLLRDKEAAATGLTQEVLAEKLEYPDELATTLEELASGDWLLTLGEAPNFRYKANLRRKRPRATSGGLWSAIANRLKDDSGPSASDPVPPDSDERDMPPDSSPPARNPTPGSRRPPFPDISKW